PAEELFDQMLPRRRARRRQEDERLPRVFLREAVQTRHEPRDRIVPRDRRELTRAAAAAALHRLREAIGVIRDLNRCLTAHAQLALTDWILGSAFELAGEPHAHHARLAVAHDLGVAFDDAPGETAAGATERTDARLPFGHAGHEILIGDESDQLVF